MGLPWLSSLGCVATAQVGLPWQEGVAITPLPEANKPAFLEGLIADAVAHGATVANAEGGGGALAGALMSPAVVDGVTPSMRLFHEEQVRSGKCGPPLVERCC